VHPPGIDDLVIRESREEDLPLLEQTSPSPGTSRFHHRRHERQVRGEAVYLIAWLDGSPVGNLCLILSGPDNDEARERLAHGPEINAFDVVPAIRNRGIGSALIDAAERRARDLGHTATVLGVEVGNHAAHRLYERLGYRDWPYGETEESYTWTDDTGTEREQHETIIWMEKQLAVATPPVTTLSASGPSRRRRR